MPIYRLSRKVDAAYDEWQEMVVRAPSVGAARQLALDHCPYPPNADSPNPPALRDIQARIVHPDAPGQAILCIDVRGG